MAIQFSTGVRNLFMMAGITKSLCGLSENNFIVFPTTATNRAITLYSGAQPTADTVVANWPTYNTGYLLHWQNIPLFNWYPDLTTPVLSNSTLPAPVTATGSGTASWAIVWAGNPAAGTGAGQIGNATIPTTGIMVVPVSDVYGAGVVKMSTTTINSGSAYMFLDFTLSAGGL